MAELNQVFKCSLCQQMVTVVGQGAGTLSCCGQPMVLITPNSTEAAVEKHVPVIAKADGGWKVTVGQAAHPMEQKHYIQWIELASNGLVQRHYLKPGSPPEAVFRTPEGPVAARAYCNLHGLWKA
jgi:superoxide reductase